jgi:pilus assembly protein CpaC
MGTRVSHIVRHQSTRYICLLTVVIAISLWGVVSAQDAGKRTINGFTPRSTLLPIKDPRTAADVKSFVDSLSSTDGMFEVIVGQARILTLKNNLAVEGKPTPLIAQGDPSVFDWEMVGTRQIRIRGMRIGVTDLSIITVDNELYTFEVQVVADLDLLRARLRETFPSAFLKLAQIRDHVIVEGQARDARQVNQIIHTIKVYLLSVTTSQESVITSKNNNADRAETPNNIGLEGNDQDPEGGGEVSLQSEKPDVQAATTTLPEIINLITVPGPQQVMLKVQIAELNRTAFRQLGMDFIFQDGSSVFGQNIGAGLPVGASGGGMDGLLSFIDPLAGGSSTAFAVFNQGKLDFFLKALRANQVFRILAEPNLVVMNGHEANFLAGGEFPIPVPQTSGGGGGGTITIEFKEFGVSLAFQPFILEDGVIRLSVSPEVSSLDDSGGLTIQGFRVPALTTRSVNTVVELREGQTLAIAGLLLVEIAGGTDRVPGLGDLPYIGSMFSNNTSETIEKELIVMVTPYLVQPMNSDEVPPLPGDEVRVPTDFEFFFKGRIEGLTNQHYRATSSWNDPLGVERRLKIEKKYISGPFGYTQ